MAKPSGSATLNTGHALATGLVGCWPLLEGSGTTSADKTAGGRTLTMVVPTWTTENSDNCFTSASGASVSCTISSNLALPGNQDWTIAWRSKQTTASSNGMICGVASTTNDFVWQRSDAGSVSLRFRDAAANTAIVTHAETVTTLNDWALVYDHSAQTVEEFYNGASLGSVSFTTGADLSITHVMSGYSTGFGFVGTFHYLYVWDNRALDSTELTTLAADPYDFLDEPPSGTVSLVCPRLVQRGASSGACAVSGTYTGATADAVQVKIFLSADNSTVVDWADVDASLSGGTWSGSVTVPTGGPYYAQARLQDSSNVVLVTTASSNSLICGDIFVTLGQSNADGRGTNTQTYGGSSVAWCVNQAGTVDTTLSDPVSNAGQGNFIPLLATLISAHVGASVPIAFIVQTAGGTGLYGSHWEPPTGAQWLLADALVDAQLLNGILAALWLQGETDSLAVSLANYTTAEQTLAAAVNAWPGSPELISTLIGQTGGGDTGMDNIRFAKIANWNSGHTLYGANPIDIDLADAGGDGIHFKTDAELAALAGQTWLALKDAVYSGTNGRGPRVSSATYNSATVTVTMDRTLATATTYTTSAWIVKDNGTPVTVSSVTKTGSTTIALVCSAPLVGPVTVTFGSGNDVVVADLPRAEAISLPATINSISSIEVLAEPFLNYTATLYVPSGGTAPFLMLGIGICG